jgi:hypothetical protein
MTLSKPPTIAIGTILAENLPHFSQMFGGNVGKAFQRHGLRMLRWLVNFDQPRSAFPTIIAFGNVKETVSPPQTSIRPKRTDVVAEDAISRKIIGVGRSSPFGELEGCARSATNRGEVVHAEPDRRYWQLLAPPVRYCHVYCGFV